jgi:outer membrane protein TolC
MAGTVFEAMEAFRLALTEVKQAEGEHDLARSQETAASNRVTAARRRLNDAIGALNSHLPRETRQHGGVQLVEVP